MLGNYKFLTNYMSSYLEYVFENSSVSPFDVEIDFVKSYLENFYIKAIENINEVDGTQKFTEYLSKINDFELSRGVKRNKLRDIIIQSIPKDLVEKIFSNINLNGIKNGDFYEKLSAINILEIIAKYDLNCTDLFESTFEVLESVNVDVWHTKAMQTYIEKYTLKIASSPALKEEDFSNDLKQKQFEFIKKYVQAVTQKRESFSIFKEKGISDIWQLINAGKLPNSKAKELLDIFEKNLKISEISRTDSQTKANNFIESFNTETTTQTEFDEFIKQIQNLKLTNSLKLEPRFVNFILKQVFDSNSFISQDPDKYKAFIERTLEDLAKNDLSAKLKMNKPYCFFIRDSLQKKDEIGYTDFGGLIVLNRTYTDYLIYNKDTKIIDTLFHENTHADQNYDVRGKEVYNYNRYIMAKEEILKRVYPAFYQANYQEMFIEIEARENAARKLGKFLESMDLSPEQKIMYFTQINNDIIEMCKEKVKLEKSKYASGEEKKVDFKEGKVKVTDLFDKTIQNHSKYLKNYPMLYIEYHINGRIKSVQEILEDLDKVDKKSQRKLYRNILRKGNIFKLCNLSKDLNSIMEYSLNDKNSNSLLSFIISDNISRMLNELLQNCEALSQEEMIKLQVTFNNVRKIIDQGENLNFIKGMNRPPKYSPEIDNTPLELMSDLEKEMARLVPDLDEKVSKETEKEQSRSITRNIIRILRKQNFAQDDVDAIKEYASTGFKEAVDNCIDDLETRRNLIRIKSYLKNISINDSRFQNLYKDNKIFATLVTGIEEYIDGENCPKDRMELYYLISDYYSMVVIGSGMTLERSELLFNCFSYDELSHSDIIKEISKSYLKAKISNNENDLKKFSEFTKKYVEYMKSSGSKFGMEYDVYITSLSEDDKKYIIESENTPPGIVASDIENASKEMQLLSQAYISTTLNERISVMSEIIKIMDEKNMTSDFQENEPQDKDNIEKYEFLDEK